MKAFKWSIYLLTILINSYESSNITVGIYCGLPLFNNINATAGYVAVICKYINNGSLYSDTYTAAYNDCNGIKISSLNIYLTLGYLDPSQYNSTNIAKFLQSHSCESYIYIYITFSK